MAGRKIRQERFAILDEIGIDGLTTLYWDCSGIREVATKLFKPAREGQKVGTSIIYDWLDERGLKDEWRRTVHSKLDCAEWMIIDEANDLPPTRESLSYLNRKLWRAKSGGGAEGYAQKYGLVPPRTPQNYDDTFLGRIAEMAKKRDPERE